MAAVKQTQGFKSAAVTSIWIYSTVYNPLLQIVSFPKAPYDTPKTFPQIFKLPEFWPMVHVMLHWVLDEKKRYTLNKD